VTERKKISTIPMKKFGIDTPPTARPVARWSASEPRRTAAMVPRGIATSNDQIRATAPSSNVAGRRSPMAAVTGWWVVIERPRSPCTMCPSQITYCT
jgi:hypothetical protein